MKYQIAGWISLVSITVLAAPYVYALCSLVQWR